MLAIQQGRRDLFRELYRRHRGAVERTCRKLLVDERDVEEAVQETFVRAHRAIGRFNGSYQVRGWLVTIARNVSVDNLRRHARQREVATPEHHVDAPSSVDDPSVQLDLRDERVEEILADMDPEQARALEMRGVEGATHKEIGEHIGRSESQVKALLYRARKAFKTRWIKAAAALGVIGYGGAQLFDWI